jgi:putative peptidoglycan lipid II flippase
LIPVACYLFVFAEPIIKIFYSRGNFSAGAATDAAGFLRLLSVTVFSIGINALVTRVFIATQAIKQAFIYQVVLNIVLIAAIWGFTTIYGAWGYPYGLILMNGLNLGLMYFICKRVAPWINYRVLLNYTALLLLIHGAIGAGFYFVAPCLHSGIIARLATGFFIYLIIIYVLMKKFQLNPAPGGTITDAGKRTD